MKNLVKMLLLPIGAFVLASAGAVTTHNDRDANTAIVQGWNRINENEPCTKLRMCDNSGSTLCKLSGVQAYQLTSPNQCSQALFHRD